MSRSRSWLFTWNNYPPDYATTLDALPANYVIAGREIAPTTNTPHLQGYVRFQNARRLLSVRDLLPAHWTIARGTPAQNIAYCTKEDAEPYSRGDAPVSSNEKGEREKARWQNAWDLAKQGQLEEM